jgi:putative peptide zinc metalloprotease protein
LASQHKDVSASEEGLAPSPELGRQQQDASAPRLSEGIELLGERESYGFKEPVYLARRADGQFLRLSRLLHLVAAEADGQKDYGQIALRVSREFGRTVSADNVRFLSEERLRPLGVLEGTEGTSGQPAKLPRAKPVLALNWRAPILPAGAARTLARVFRPFFFAPVVIAVLAGFAALDIWLFFVRGLSQSAQQVLYQPELFLMVFGLTFLSGLFHEFGHATACYYGGAKPGRIGVGLYLVWPVFYSDVTEAYRLGRTGRLLTDLGGVYFNAIFSLAMAGAYFLSGFEPLLLVIFLQHVLMLYQFMPFLRLDGYYLVSDITGVPDLFARIKPILRSMIPGSRTDRQVQELKPWARAVVTAWVLAVIPVLLYLLGVMIVRAPQLYATAWDSFFVHYDDVRDAFAGGKVVEVVAGLLQIVLLVIPVAGLTLTFALVGKELSEALRSSLEGRPLLRIYLASAALAFVIGCAGVALADHVLLAPRGGILGVMLLILTVAALMAWKLPTRRTARWDIRLWWTMPARERQRRRERALRRRRERETRRSPGA